MDAPAVRLEVVAGKAAGTSIVVEDELVIGRHAEGPGRLADDEEISRAHARVAVDGSRFGSVEDLGSTNGTFVNGLRISSPQTLAVGDTIEMGATTLVVREVPSDTDPGADAAEQPVVAPRSQATLASGVRPSPVGPAEPPADQADRAEAPAPEATPSPPLESPAAADSSAAAEPPAAAGSFDPTEALPAPAEPEPEQAEPEPQIPTLELRLEIDFSAREARVFLDRASEPVRLVFDEGTWRAATPQMNEKGPPA